MSFNTVIGLALNNAANMIGTTMETASNMYTEQAEVQNIEANEAEPMKYTIQDGDCLWNIAKNEYSLTNNADIDTMVGYLAEYNNIENPDLIYTGSELSIPEYEYFYPDENSKEEPNVGEQFNDWTNSHADLMLQFDNYEDYKNSDEAKELGLDFDFMEGKDAKNSDDYNLQVGKLAQNEIDSKDTDGNGTISQDEYIQDEFMSVVDDYKALVENGVKTKEEAVEELSNAYTECIAVYQIIDQKMGNGDNEVDKDEFSSYYQHLDEYDNEERTVDGKINIENVADYPEYLASQVNITDETKEHAKNVVESWFDTEENQETA